MPCPQVFPLGVLSFCWYYAEVWIALKCLLFLSLVVTNSIMLTDSSSVEAVALVVMNISMEMAKVPLHTSFSAHLMGKMWFGVRVPSLS